MKQQMFILPLFVLLLATVCDQTPDGELVDTLWTLKSIELPGESTILAWPSIDVNITFANDGGMSGGSFCNRYFGDYRMGGANSLDISMGWTTERGCYSDYHYHGEDTYFALLPTVDDFAIDGNLLELTTPDGAILTFRNFP